uniref:Uncharacterized protein n=1 Tax=Arundo donax TaxID=35708 RepID=A0A0A8Z7S5_ARUDO
MQSIPPKTSEQGPP